MEALSIDFADIYFKCGEDLSANEAARKRAPTMSVDLDVYYVEI